jgi:hypothetical protein
MPRTRKFSNAVIIQSLRTNKGLVYRSAAAIGCTPQTIYNRAKVEPKVAECIEEEEGKVGDVCELKLMERIYDGDLGAIKFWLSTKGRKRGFGDQVQITGKVETDVLLTEDAKAALISAIAGKLLAMEEGSDDGEAVDAVGDASEPGAAEEENADLGSDVVEQDPNWEGDGSGHALA